MERIAWEAQLEVQRLLEQLEAWFLECQELLHQFA
jgi:hypothetical protein